MNKGDYHRQQNVYMEIKKRVTDYEFDSHMCCWSTKDVVYRNGTCRDYQSVPKYLYKDEVKVLFGPPPSAGAGMARPSSTWNGPAEKETKRRRTG